MRWSRTSGGRVEDLRGRGSMGRRVGGGLGGAGVLGIVIALLVTFLGGGGGAFDPSSSLDDLPTAPSAGGGLEGPDPDANLVAFMNFLDEDIQNYWAQAFQESGSTYEPTRLRLFSNGISTGCGQASAAVGPFYCPQDRAAYLDLSFFRELRDRFGAPGDFAQAYVIAHEYGHHVQNIAGILPRVSDEQRANPGEANALSVKLELQADCLAGVWAHSAYAQNQLDAGDLEEGLAAAESVGDDRLQQQARGQVRPDTFTYGTSAQRRTWFMRGFQDGRAAVCDTFTASDL